MQSQDYTATDQTARNINNLSVAAPPTPCTPLILLLDSEYNLAVGLRWSPWQ